MIKRTSKYLVICLLSFLTMATLPEKDLSSPRATMNFFLKSMKEYKKGNSKGLELAVYALSSEGIPKAIKTLKLKDYSIQLSSILDRIEYIDVRTIPKELEDSIWYYRKEVISIKDKNIAAEISIRKSKDGEWLFTKETIDSLNAYELKFKDKSYVESLVAHKSLKNKIKMYLPLWAFNAPFLLTNIHWIFLVAILMICFIADRIVRHYIAAKAIEILKRRNIKFTVKQQDRLTAPFGLITFSYLFKTLSIFIELPSEFLLMIVKCTDIIMAVATILLLNQLLTVVCIYLEDKARTTENKFDDILVPLVRKTARFFIFSVGIIFIGDALDLNMKSILAGMGIGGIAFALAAKDTISNIFGSFTVLFDNPFTIGDWVKIDGGGEGIVEEVGFRSTRIRTFHNSLLTIPNGNLISANIDNLGRRQYRRFTTSLGIDYATPPEKIENFCESIRQLIIAHPKTRKETFQVYFNSMGSSSLNILVYMFWSVASWDDELNEKHKFLLDILRIAKQHDINFAFPTQTLHVQNDEGVTYTSEAVDFEKSKNISTSLENERWALGNRSSTNNCN